jgi:hypothetical protein
MLPELMTEIHRVLAEWSLPRAPSISGSNRDLNSGSLGP